VAKTVERPPLSDDELVYRRIPRTSAWFEEPDKITTANFKLDRRRQEFGVSVYRASIVTAEQVLAQPAAMEGSLVASATIGAIRNLRSGAGTPLNLDVIAVDDERNPGHCEIRGPEPGKITAAASKALRDVFQLG
jgi:hypothetical protein